MNIYRAYCLNNTFVGFLSTKRKSGNWEAVVKRRIYTENPFPLLS